MKVTGTMYLSGSYWVVDGPPPLLRDLKAVLPRVDPMKTGGIRIRRSPYIGARLQWLGEWHDIEMDPGPREDLHADAEAWRLQERELGGILAGKVPERVFQMTDQPRDYQRVAVELALLIRRFLLADQTGTGKSLCMMAMMEAGLLPAVGVMPVNLILQWEPELKRLLPGINVLVLRGRTPYDVREAMARQLVQERRKAEMVIPDVCLLNYDIADSWGPALATRNPPKFTFFDECSALSNPESLRTKGSRALSEASQYCVGADATPAGAYGAQIHPVVDVITLGRLGDWPEFKREWCTDEEDRLCRVREPDLLREHLKSSGMVLRRTRNDVGLYLDPVTYIPYRVDVDRAPLDAVRPAMKVLAARILADQYGKGQAAATARMSDRSTLARVMRKSTAIGKAPHTADLLNFLASKGERVFVVAWHIETYNIFQRRLGAKWAPAFFTGQQDKKQKAEALRRFKAHETPFLIASIRGVAGIDGLQGHCSIGMQAEFDWNPHKHTQAMDRIWRPGQKEKVCWYVPYTDEGSDPVMMEVTGAKHAASSPILDAVDILDDNVDPAHIIKLAEQVLRG